MLNEELKATGDVSLVLRDETGKVIQTTEIKNLVVTSGLGFISSRMKDATATAMSHMAVGTGTTAAALGQTALVTEAARVALTSTTVTGAQIVYVASFGAGTGTGALTEAGILNASTGGTMLCRTVFSAINKGASDTLSVTWTITIS